MRLRRFKEDKPRRKVPASQTWLHLFVRQCDNDRLFHLSALVLFMSTTGARVSEAVSLQWPQVDLVGRKAMLLQTKTETSSERHLTDELVGRMHLLPRLADTPVFCYTSRYSVNERIEAVCHRAGIPYKSSHACGRHSFATNAIALAWMLSPPWKQAAGDRRQCFSKPMSTPATLDAWLPIVSTICRSRPGFETSGGVVVASAFRGIAPMLKGEPKQRSQPYGLGGRSVDAGMVDLVSLGRIRLFDRRTGLDSVLLR